MSNLNIVAFQDGIHQLLIGVQVNLEDKEYFNVLYPTVLNLQKETGTGRLTAALIPILPEQLTVGETPVWQYPINRIVRTKTTSLTPNLVKSYTDMYLSAVRATNNVPAETAQVPAQTPAQTPAKMF